MDQSIHTVAIGDLIVGYRDVGDKGDPVAILLHGFPYDIRAYDAVAERLVRKGFRCIVPYLRGFGATRFVDEGVQRSGQQAALGHDLRCLMDALGIGSAFLAGYDWGGRAACIVSALWPEGVRGLVTCGEGYNIQNIAGSLEPSPPHEEQRYWYIYYFNTERGRRALETQPVAFCRHIWTLWSPNWEFQEAEFDASSTSFLNVDFAEIVIHSYRHRLGAAEGDPQFSEIEERLAQQPQIPVPSIILQGGDDTVDPPTPLNAEANGFSGPLSKHILPGVGHNIPQEAPIEFADAVLQLRDMED